MAKRGVAPLRRDQVYLTEKDESGASRLYSIAEFKERNIHNLRRRYLQGRYGALPSPGRFGGLSRAGGPERAGWSEAGGWKTVIALASAKLGHDARFRSSWLCADDTNTAPAYFNELKRQVKQHVTLNVLPARRQGVSPDTVVQQAIKERKELRKGKDREDQGHRVGPD